MSRSQAVRWPSILSTRNAAEFTGTSPGVIRRAVADGQLRAGRRGRLLTFTRADLERWAFGERHRRARDRKPSVVIDARPIIIEIVEPRFGSANDASIEQPTPISAAARAAQRWGLELTRGEP